MSAKKRNASRLAKATKKFKLPVYTNLTEISDLDSLEEKPVFFPVNEAYDNSILMKPMQKRHGAIHPSAIGMCMRRGVYGLMGYPANNEFDAGLLEIFDTGHKVHDLVQGRLRSDLIQKAVESLGATKYSFKEEIPVDKKNDELYKNWLVAGTTDGVLEVEGLGWKQRMVVEIKSINTTDFDALSSPHRSHMLQAHLYAYRFNTPIILMIYFNKNNSRKKFFFETFSEDIFAEAMYRVEHQYTHYKNGTLPEREDTWFNCRSCPYKKVCDPPVLNRGKYGT